MERLYYYSFFVVTPGSHPDKIVYIKSEGKINESFSISNYARFREMVKVREKTNLEEITKEKYEEAMNGE